MDAGWESSAAPFARRPMQPVAGAGDTLRTISGFSSTAGRDRCHRQFIGPPMAAGQVFDTSVTYKAYAQGLEGNNKDNLRSRIGIRIVSRDGSTVRHTIKAIADYSSGTEWGSVASQQGVPRWRRWNRLVHDRRGRSARGGVRPQRCLGRFDLGLVPLGLHRNRGRCTGERDHDVDHRSSVVRVLAHHHVRDGHAQAHQVTRYVNTASTPGGDGTTNDTVGANRAFASLVTALTTLAATDWAGANQQLRILCTGVTPDRGDAVVTAAWNGHLSPECYLEIIGDQPSALAISTSHYRCVDTEPAGLGVYGGGYVRLSRVGYAHHGGSGDRRVFGGGRPQ